MQLEPTKPMAGAAPAPITARRWTGLRGGGPLVGLVLVCLLGALLNENFASLDNVMNVLTR
ncbi:MAG: ABC transporter permease, partial [Polaromonas sp.]|nr:ABC transporter permease [Polaromonas sp.]